MTRRRVQQNAPAMTSPLLRIYTHRLAWPKITAMYLFHYYDFFLENNAQKAGLMGCRF
jgi:hypothetical protein